MKFLIVLLSLSVLLFQAAYANPPSVSVSKGQIETVQPFKSAYVKDRFLTVWLPPGYNKQSQYDVLYMHDGRMLFDANSTWNKQEWRVDEVAGELIEQGKIRPIIVVGIPNAVENRHSEFFPQQPFERLSPSKQQALYKIEKYADHPLFASKVYSDNYSLFIVNEVIPYIEAHYSVNKGQQHRYLGGSSMGGLISWYTLLNYPDQFAGTINMSTHWPGTFSAEDDVFPVFQQYMAANLHKLTNQKVYFDYGDSTLDAMYPELQKQIDKIFIEQQYPKDQWRSLYFPGADHTENAWSKRLHVPLIFMFGTNKSS